MLFDAATGTLRDDFDGSGSGAAVVFATLQDVMVLAVGDFGIA